MQYAALMLGGALMVSLPSQAHAQAAKTAFQENYADVNGMRICRVG